MASALTDFLRANKKEVVVVMANYSIRDTFSILVPDWRKTEEWVGLHCQTDESPPHTHTHNTEEDLLYHIGISAHHGATCCQLLVQQRHFLFLFSPHTGRTPYMAAR